MNHLSVFDGLQYIKNIKQININNLMKFMNIINLESFNFEVAQYYFDQTFFI